MKNLFFVIVTVFGLQGCGIGAQALDKLPQVIATVQDATSVLQTIDRVARPYFMLKGTKQQLREYDERYAQATDALNVALRAAQGVEKVDNEQVGAAFDDFETAYRNLTTLLQSNGLMAKPGDALGANPDKPQITVPAPLALSRD